MDTSSSDVPLPLPEPQKWKHRPMMLRKAAGIGRGDEVGYNHVESVFPVDTEHFSGHMYFRFRGLDGEPSEYFEGKARRLSCVVQGRVKRPIVMGDCQTGYEFDKPFQYIPAKLIVKSALKFVRGLAPTLTEDILGKRPYFLNPLFQTIQQLHVAEPGSEPVITGTWSESNCLLGGVFAQRSLSNIARKKFFASRSNGALHSLTPDHVYTMEFYEDKIDPSTFDLVILGMRFPLYKYIGCQPLQIMGKVNCAPHQREYLFNVELWHETLFAHDRDTKEPTSVRLATPRT